MASKYNTFRESQKPTVPLNVILLDYLLVRTSFGLSLASVSVEISFPKPASPFMEKHKVVHSLGVYTGCLVSSNLGVTPHVYRSGWGEEPHACIWDTRGGLRHWVSWDIILGSLLSGKEASPTRECELGNHRSPWDNVWPNLTSLCWLIVLNVSHDLRTIDEITWTVFQWSETDALLNYGTWSLPFCLCGLSWSPSSHGELSPSSSIHEDCAWLKYAVSWSVIKYEL